MKKIMLICVFLLTTINCSFGYELKGYCPSEPKQLNPKGKLEKTYVLYICSNEVLYFGTGHYNSISNEFIMDNMQYLSDPNGMLIQCTCEDGPRPTDKQPEIEPE